MYPSISNSKSKENKKERLFGELKFFPSASQVNLNYFPSPFGILEIYFDLPWIYWQYAFSRFDVGFFILVKEQHEFPEINVSLVIKSNFLAYFFLKMKEFSHVGFKILIPKLNKIR